MTTEIKETSIKIAESALNDLKSRIDQARFPEKEPVTDWSQGIPLSYVQKIADYWRNDYDWHRCEKQLNQYPQFTTEIDGVEIFFLHIRSPHAEARPMIMTHGWPGSIIEFMDVIGPLTDPAAHGGEAADAYHLVIPCLPGYGFSGKPAVTGWNAEKIAAAWDELMLRLGYDRYFAQGGDWGALITSAIGIQNKGHCAALHVNMVVVGRPSLPILLTLNAKEKNGIKLLKKYQAQEAGYAEIQRTKPQTLGYALVDSPVGQMAWIMEKFHGWSDVGEGNPDSSFALDHMLDNVMLYWLTNSAASSARLYRESFGKPNLDRIDVPAGASIFPEEIFQPSRRWAQNRFKKLQYWNEPDKGGHFAAMEVPEIFIAEVRACFRNMSL